MSNPIYDLPELFRERIEQLVGLENRNDLLSKFIKKPTTLRANTLKMTGTQLKETLKANNIAYEALSWCDTAILIKDTTIQTLEELPEYKNGSLYIQSLSSMIPALVLSPQPEDKVLDICSAPGSKTTQMAAMMKNTGKIVASDNSRIRIYKLEANIAMQGVTNVTVKFLPGQSMWEQYPEYFDKTLVDVPCSMEGRIDINDPKSYKDWSIKKIKELKDRQKWLLRSAISATKEGGEIVYSTCTLAPEENEEVIDWILKKEKGNVEIMPITLPCDALKPGLSAWGEKTYDPSLTLTKRIYPSDTMEGFYIAKLKKVRSTVTEGQKTLMQELRNK